MLPSPVSGCCTTAPRKPGAASGVASLYGTGAATSAHTASAVYASTRTPPLWRSTPLTSFITPRPAIHTHPSVTGLSKVASIDVTKLESGMENHVSSLPSHMLSDDGHEEENATPLLVSIGSEHSESVYRRTSYTRESAARFSALEKRYLVYAAGAGVPAGYASDASVCAGYVAPPTAQPAADAHTRLPPPSTTVSVTGTHPSSAACMPAAHAAPHESASRSR